MKTLHLGFAACFIGSIQLACVDAGNSSANSTGGYAGIAVGVSNTAVGGNGNSGSKATPCGPVNPTPFGCKFAWGAPSNGSNYANLDFVSTWIGDETNGGLQTWSATAVNLGDNSQNSCGDCALVESVANSASMVVFYAYFIGFQACKSATSAIVTHHNRPTFAPTGPSGYATITASS